MPKKYSHRSKYNVKKEKPICDGIKFDSKAEMRCYQTLKEYEEVQIVRFQPQFLLLESFEYYDLIKDKKRKYSKMRYTSDFEIKIKGIDRNIIVEYKGMIRPDYSMRKKMWYNLFGNDYYFLEIRGIKNTKEQIDELLKRVDKNRGMERDNRI